jgi:hypothetical protein
MTFRCVAWCGCQCQGMALKCAQRSSAFESCLIPLHFLTPLPARIVLVTCSCRLTAAIECLRAAPSATVSSLHDNVRACVCTRAPSTAPGTARTSVGIQLAGTKVRGLIPCGPAALSQRLFVGDEILRVDKAEAGLTRQRFPCVKLVPLLCVCMTGTMMLV